MIKAEEFRLGNLVYCKGKIDKLTRVEDNNYCTENCGHGVWNDDLEPIVLTEEILLRLGFEDIGNNTWQFNGVDLFYTEKGCLLMIKEISYFNKTYIYLHDIQNLYFALTGKELEINL